MLCQKKNKSSSGFLWLVLLAIPVIAVVRRLTESGTFPLRRLGRVKSHWVPPYEPELRLATLVNSIWKGEIRECTVSREIFKLATVWLPLVDSQIWHLGAGTCIQALAPLNLCIGKTLCLNISRRSPWAIVASQASCLSELKKFGWTIS